MKEQLEALQATLARIVTAIKMPHIDELVKVAVNNAMKSVAARQPTDRMRILPIQAK